MNSLLFPDAADVAPPDPRVISDILTQEPPAAVTHGVDQSAWTHFIADVMAAQHMLQHMLLQQSPWVYGLVSDRFQRYDALITDLSKQLSLPFDEEQERIFVEKIHQFRMAFWSLYQLLRQVVDTSIPHLLQEMSVSVEAATRLMRRLEDEQPPSAGNQAMRFQLERLLFSLDRCSTLESCRSAMRALDTHRRHLQQEHVTQRLLAGPPSLACASGRHAPWGRTLAPQDVLTMQSAYGAPHALAQAGPPTVSDAGPLGTSDVAPYVAHHPPPYAPPPYAPPPYVLPYAQPHAPPYVQPYAPPYTAPYAQPHARPYGTPPGAPPARPYGAPRSHPYGPPRGHAHGRPTLGRHPSPQEGRLPSPQTVRPPAPQAGPLPAFPLFANHAAPLDSPPVTLGTSPNSMFWPFMRDARTDAVPDAGLRTGDASAPLTGPAPLQPATEVQVRAKGRPRRAQPTAAAMLQGTTVGTKVATNAVTDASTDAGTDAGTEPTKRAPRRKRPSSDATSTSARTSGRMVISTVTRTDVRTVVQSSSTARPLPGASGPDDGRGPGRVTMVFPRPLSVPLEAAPQEPEPLVLEVFEEPIVVEDESSSSSTSSQGTSTRP